MQYYRLGKNLTSSCFRACPLPSLPSGLSPPAAELGSDGAGGGGCSQPARGAVTRGGALPGGGVLRMAASRFRPDGGGVQALLLGDGGGTVMARPAARSRPSG